MSLLMDAAPPRQLSMHAPVREPDTAEAADRLRETTAAVRLRFRWLGAEKTLTVAQRAEAADNFGAERQVLSAAKKLLDTGHPAFRAVTAVRGKLTGAWKAATLPYPEPGVRLIPRDRIPEFDRQLADLRTELDDAVSGLDQRYGELKEVAARRLGRLFNPDDYPASLSGWFAAEWDYPPVAPPDYLRRLSPELYERECRRLRGRFEEAVALAESAFLEEFAKLVGRLSERIAGADDGRPKVFRDSAVTNLAEFFERFRTLNVRSDADLERLVERTRRLLEGVEPRDLREGDQLRRLLARDLAAVSGSLDQLLVDRPRRRVLRGAGPTLKPAEAS